MPAPPARAGRRLSGRRRPLPREEPAWLDNTCFEKYGLVRYSAARDAYDALDVVAVAYPLSQASQRRAITRLNGRGGAAKTVRWADARREHARPVVARCAAAALVQSLVTSTRCEHDHALAWAAWLHNAAQHAVELRE